MTCIPDARKKEVKTGEEKEPNPYYEGNLAEKDREYIRGYDYAVNGVFKTMFDNIGEYNFSVEGEDMEMGRFLCNHPEIRQKMREVFEYQFELERNEIVAAMIDGYNEKA